MNTKSPAMQWSYLASVLLSRVYRTLLITLTLVALAPIAFSWGSFVIKTGSMEPVIQPGDVVIAKPVEEDQQIAVGRVYVFEDPSREDKRLTVHRVVERRDDGDYTTAGDANEVTDFAPVKSDGFHSQAILLVQYVGLPIVWYLNHAYFKLMLWLLFTMAAFVLAAKNLEDEPPKWTLWRLWRERGAEKKAEKAATGKTMRITTAGPLAAGLVLGLAIISSGTAAAGFTDITKNGSNTWTAGAWTQRYVAAVQQDNPTGFWLLDEAAGPMARDRSVTNKAGIYGNTVQFSQPGALPGNPGTSINPNGSKVTLTPDLIAGPITGSTELWFKTGSITGGLLFGFESNFGSADRTLKMTTTGQLIYGDWNASPYKTTVTPGSYNNNVWHHVVVTTAPTGNRQSVDIYVDGALVAIGDGSGLNNTSGRWVIGASTGVPSFNGLIDNVAIFSQGLTAARVQAHYAAR